MSWNNPAPFDQFFDMVMVYFLITVMKALNIFNLMIWKMEIYFELQTICGVLGIL